ncbi:hypothetical protein WNY51_04665 [Pseudocolwellia sp. AS88]|uniref:hypothetical protein n=1 Tax=Pseudocolwellia sp. AS88 TaxID=3063958 RepID=UPI0026F0A271|nr:hypothetical protein [Pseudocolwellia sp. AS88]MDO7086727.1 hypothetical protein [Pseudocolwellia sp. AS88]
MNLLYKIPLHGIACKPFFDLKNHEIKHSININFSELNLNTFNNSIKEKAPDWIMEDKGERYQSIVSLTINQNKQDPSASTQYVLKIDCQGKGLFTINKNNIDVSWNDQGTDSAHYFQTIGLALWLELNNILCIHANALAYKEHAIAFVAPSRTGKTTLTAELCKLEFAVMTDDMMALHQEDKDYIIYPSWPVARMWPETLEIIDNQNNDELVKVHESFAKKIININKSNGFDFCNQPKKLKTIYILNRVEQINKNNDNISNVCNITTISSAEAVILLIQNSILGSAYKALSLEQQRFFKLTELVKNLKVKKITYLSGKQYLSEVRQTIINDLES